MATLQKLFGSIYLRIHIGMLHCQIMIINLVFRLARHPQMQQLKLQI